VRQMQTRATYVIMTDRFVSVGLVGLAALLAALVTSVIV